MGGFSLLKRARHSVISMLILVHSWQCLMHPAVLINNTTSFIYDLPTHPYSTNSCLQRFPCNLQFLHTQNGKNDFASSVYSVNRILDLVFSPLPELLVYHPFLHLVLWLLLFHTNWNRHLGPPSVYLKKRHTVLLNAFWLNSEEIGGRHGWWTVFFWRW